MGHGQDVSIIYAHTWTHGSGTYTEHLRTHIRNWVKWRSRSLSLVRITGALVHSSVGPILEHVDASWERRWGIIDTGPRLLNGEILSKEMDILVQLIPWWNIPTIPLNCPITRILQFLGKRNFCFASVHSLGKRCTVHHTRNRSYFV